MKQIDNKIYPTEGMHLKNIHNGEIYPDEIIPAKSLTADDFINVSEEEYNEYMKQFYFPPEPPADYFNDEATAEDYENALKEVGVL